VQGDGGYTTRHVPLYLTAALSPVHDGAHLLCLRPWRLHSVSPGVQLGWWLSPGHLLKPLFHSVTTSLPCSAPGELSQLAVGISSVSSPSSTAVCHICLPAPCTRAIFPTGLLSVRRSEHQKRGGGYRQHAWQKPLEMQFNKSKKSSSTDTALTFLIFLLHAIISANSKTPDTTSKPSFRPKVALQENKPMSPALLEEGWFQIPTPRRGKTPVKWGFSPSPLPADPA